MKKILLTSLAILGCSFVINAQDGWTPVIGGGFDNTYNTTITTTQVFNGKIYAGTGIDSASVYSSASGDPGTWEKKFTEPGYTTIDAMAVTSEGTGRMYLSEFTYITSIQKVLKTTDGDNWVPYFNANNRVKHIIPFNGTGTADSIYIVIEATSGDMILKSSYDSNDPDNLSGSWDTVLNFDQIFTYERINCISEFNNKLFFGTSYAQLYSSSDGNNWTQNTFAGSGFSNINNIEFTSIGSNATHIYIGTKNYTDGGQIWRSSDETIWDSVKQFSTNEEKVTSINSIGANFWITTYSWGPNAGKVYKTADGINYLSSNNNGFGFDNNGTNGRIIAFGNNIYASGENYFPGATPIFGINTQNSGGQIWRLCSFTPVQVVATPPSATYCQGIATPPVFSGSAGFTNYMWDNSSPSPSGDGSFSGSGQHFLTAIDANGCSSFDTITVNLLPSPSSYFNSPESSPATLCKDETMLLTTINASNLRTNLPALSSTNTVAIMDAAYAQDSITVAGIFDDGAPYTLVNVTIDSLYHPNNGELYITLYAPDGSYINLSGYNGFGTQNFIGTVFSQTASTSIMSGSGPFTGSYVPTDPFYYLSGSTNGVWRIEIYDNQNLNEGFLKGWSLNFSEPDTNMTYSWLPAMGLSSVNTANTIATGITTTSYSLTITNAIGCSTTDTVILEVPAINITAATATVCYGISTVLNANGGSTYYWSPPTSLSTTTGSSVTTNSPTNITYYVNDTISGCPLVDSVFVTANPQLLVTASPAASICYADTTILSATASGGTPGYTFFWNDGSGGSFLGQNAAVAPLSSVTYSLTVFDANGCYTGSATNITIIPSTDVIGHVTYSGGNVTAGNVVALKYIPTYTHFDTIQVAALDAGGNYVFTALNSGTYLIKVFADTIAYPTLNSTYFGNTFSWTTATQLLHGCSIVETADILMIEELGIITAGPGNLRGRILEDFGFGRTPGDPIPGLDVKLGKNPGGAMVTSTTTSNATASDGGGYFYFPDIPYSTGLEYYTVYVDIPGLGTDSSYTFQVNATTSQYMYLDYVVDSTTIHFVPNAGVGISNPEMAKENKFNVFPNPSNGNATVSYSLLTDADVNVSVYNVLGIKTAELVNSKQTAGEYKLNLNLSYNKLTSGIYFISLIIDGKTTTQRLVITE
jgi:subtilisin-like proprotein convertase family protein